MAFLLEKCTFRLYNQELIDKCSFFDCGHDDLNEFFAQSAVNYSNKLLGKTYCFTLDSDPTVVVCAFTISNDSIKTSHLPNARKKKVDRNIPNSKRMRSYPAVLIGRLGVHKDYQALKGEANIGMQLMNFIKAWFIDEENKTGCRFIVVDSYNGDVALRYYSKNGFEFLFSKEEQEREFTGLDAEAELNTRLMFFDLIVLTQ